MQGGSATGRCLYELPASDLVEGLSTDDGQDIIGLAELPGMVLATVYTPRPDNPDADADNMDNPETRVYSRDEMVRLAVFDDNGADLSGHPRARILGSR